ncbi:MAG: HNH endonuclease, partial [Actinobacteria bacterium]|nr:HNH endonuclease [Actinomycetota bacterium]
MHFRRDTRRRRTTHVRRWGNRNLVNITSWRVFAASATLVVGLGAVPSVGAESRTDLLVKGPSDTYQAIELLNTIRIERERPAGYRRTLFKHWLDVDGDGCDAREQVLKRDATGLPQVDPFKCFVVEADWVSPYDGKKTSDRTEVDIDHVVALKEAWDSGAWGWTESQRTAYANDTSDPRSLLAVSSSSNRSKSDKDPSNWLPPLRSYWCIYVSNWISVKARWNLSMDESEWGRVNNLLSGQCAGTTLRGWTAPPVAVTSPATTTSLVTPTTVATTAAPTVTTIASVATTIARSATVTTLGT